MKRDNPESRTFGQAIVMIATATHVFDYSSTMLANIARRGGIEKITDYWEVASFFEVTIHVPDLL